MHRRSSTASSIATREESTPFTTRRGIGAWVATMSACTSTGRARRPSIAMVTQVPLTGAVDAREEQPGGIGHLGDAVAGHLEAADLVGGAEAVLQGSHEAQRGLAVAFEAAHHIHEVFEQPGAGDRAVFRDVADEHHGQVAVLRDADERARDLAHLRRLPGRPVGHRRRHRLHRVDDHERGLHRVDVPEDRGEVGLGREVELVGEASGAFGAQAHLARGFFGADVEHARARAGGSGCDLEQQGRLADSGFAAQQDGGTGDDAAAEHPVELADAGGPVRDLGAAELGDRAGGAALGNLGRRDRVDRAPRARRRCPRPGIPGSCRTTWRRSSRTREHANPGVGGRAMATA